MVVRRRIRAILIPLIAYSLAGAAVGYFVWEARYGARGLETRGEYEAEISRLTNDYESLKLERRQWQHRVALMQADSVDSDLLDEEAHVLLSRFDRRDLVIFLDSAATK
ncbi:MAG: septum formation initiator family protein [Methylobacteriaceae bacterium]|nr:septum formation initiator family protein [Methylobacteriaceae bacterium]MBV9705043.1 septum formation initiator family protein [Methylobacteriaceae bacterium]